MAIRRRTAICTYVFFFLPPNKTNYVMHANIPFEKIEPGNVDVIPTNTQTKNILYIAVETICIQRTEIREISLRVLQNGNQSIKIIQG